MKSIVSAILIILLAHICSAQQFKSLKIEKKNIDANNLVFRAGNAFCYDFEIVDKGEIYKLSVNKGFGEGNFFELVEKAKDTIDMRIHMLVPGEGKKERTNRNQTEIYYLYGPNPTSIPQTGVVENEENVWIHPPREGFFRSLETCPFPYVKLPLEVSRKWEDKMKISDSWSHEKWGQWEKKLLLNYTYEVVDQEKVSTGIGELDCYVIDAYADSNIGRTKLKSYYSEQYGFVRMEYEMATGLKVNLWLAEHSEGNVFGGFLEVIEFVKNKIN